MEPGGVKLMSGMQGGSSEPDEVPEPVCCEALSQGSTCIGERVDGVADTRSQRWRWMDGWTALTSQLIDAQGIQQCIRLGSSTTHPAHAAGGFTMASRW
jgi:hypothetical protein